MPSSPTMTSSPTPPRVLRRPRGAAVTAAVTLGVLMGITGCAAAGADVVPTASRTARPATEPRPNEPRPATEARPAGSTTDKAAQAELARTLDAAVAAGVPGLIVRVDDGKTAPRTVVKQSRTSATDDRLRATDSFVMGSNTKTLTAVLVLQLVDEGRIGLDDPVERWLPGAVPDGDAITVRMLLNHTSGLADYAYDPDALATMTGMQQDAPTTEQLLAIGADQPLLFPPGQGWSYSNSGYSALELILEDVTGRSYADLVERRISRPLGLRRTVVPTTAPDAGDRRLAHGYEPDAEQLAPILPPGTPDGFGFVGPLSGGLVDVTGIDQSWGGAAGGAVSTAADWARFDRALMGGELVPAHLLAQMMTTVDQEGPATEGRRYGLGLEEVSTPCGTVWGHDGALPGYRSDNYTDQTGTRTMSVLTTTHFGLVLDPAMAAAQEEVLTAAACAMLGQPVPAAD